MNPVEGARDVSLGQVGVAEGVGVRRGTRSTQPNGHELPRAGGPAQRQQRPRPGTWCPKRSAVKGFGRQGVRA